MNRRPNLKKRQAILEASLVEFQKNGYQNANMDTIAELAQVSKRTVYNHFPSKQALFGTIAETAWEQANQATQQDFDPAISVSIQLKELALKELKLVSDPKFFQLAQMLMGELMRNDSVAQETLARMKEQESTIGLWMDQCKSVGLLEIDDPNEAGKHFLGLIKARAFWPQLMGEPPIPANGHPDIAQQVVTMFLSVYGPTEQ